MSATTPASVSGLAPAFEDDNDDANEDDISDDILDRIGRGDGDGAIGDENEARRAAAASASAEKGVKAEDEVVPGKDKTA